MTTLPPNSSPPYNGIIRSSSKLELDGLSNEVLENIMRHLAERTLRTKEVFAPPPSEILELAATNKRFRFVASRLTKDSIRWSNEILFEDLDPEVIACPHLSMDMDQPLSFPRPDECAEVKCRNIYSFIAWFMFSIPSMKSLDFSLIWKSVPFREADYLIKNISEADTRLEKLLVEVFNNDTIKKQIICSSLNTVLEKNAENLHSLHIHVSGPILWSEFHSHLFQSLKKLYLQVCTEGTSWKLEDMLLFIQHCSNSVEYLNKLKLCIGENCFLWLPKIQNACPNLKRLHIIVKPSKKGRIPFPTLQDLMVLSVSSLCIEEWEPIHEEDHFEVFAQFVVENRNLQAIEFKNCTLPTLALELEKHGRKLGEKIKRLCETTSTKPKHSLMKQVELFCPNVERLFVQIEREDMEYIRQFLVKSSMISEVFIGVVGEQKFCTDDLEEVIKGLELCTGTITSFSMFHVSTSPTIICNLLDCFDENLVSFCLWLSNELESDHLAGINKILNHLLGNQKFRNMEELCIQLMGSENSHDEAAETILENEEEEIHSALRTECQELITKLEMQCQGLDSEFLRTCLQLDTL